MDIRPQASGSDPISRQRQLERLTRERGPSASNGETQSAGDPSRHDSSEVDTRSAATARFVNILSKMDPTDLHRIEDLRNRIADGSYTATPEELVDPLLEALNDDA